MKGVVKALTLCEYGIMISALIKDLGGIRKVAAETGSTRGAVANWSHRNTVPWKYRHAVARMAAKLAVQLPDNFWNEEAA